MYHMGIEYNAEQLVFVDESACDRRIARGYGRAVAGRRVTRKTVFVRGKRYSNPNLSNVTYAMLDIQSCLQFASTEYLL